MSPLVTRASSIMMAAFVALACDGSPLWDLPECHPSFDEAADLGFLISGNTDGVDTPYSLSVIDSSRSHMRLEADPENNPPDEPYLDLELHDLVSPAVDLPLVGEDVTGLGGQCEHGKYVRLVDASGEILFEGGNPWCPTVPLGLQWEPSPLFGGRRAAEPRRCRMEREGEVSDECCCVTAIPWEVTLRVDDIEEDLPTGERREFTLGGRPYLAHVIIARELFDSPCTRDYRSVLGTAYLAPLAE